MGSSNGKKRGRRSFLKTSAAAVGAIGTTGAAPGETAPRDGASQKAPDARVARRPYNGPYTGEHLSRIAFPLGGMGAGMVCLEGVGALSHVSLRHRPEVFNEPLLFAALWVKGAPARVLEGPVPPWKLYGRPEAANGLGGSSYGLPRFQSASFLARFPFGTVALEDPRVPLVVELTGWSPFEPGDADGASLPVAGIEYSFHNRSNAVVEAVSARLATLVSTCRISTCAPTTTAPCGSVTRPPTLA